MYRKYDVQQLIMALHTYFDAHNKSYFPVDTDTMHTAIKAVIDAQANAFGSNDADARVWSVLSSRDGTEPSVRKLINLATALSDFDPVVHDQLLYVQGKIIRD